MILLYSTTFVTNINNFYLKKGRLSLLLIPLCSKRKPVKVIFSIERGVT